MSKRVTILAMLAAVSAVWANAHAGTTNAPLTFYVVSKQRIEGGQLFNRFPFPELGYISSKPDLIVERIKDVSSLPESSRPGWAEDRNDGTRKKATMLDTLPRDTLVEIIHWVVYSSSVMLETIAQPIPRAEREWPRQKQSHRHSQKKPAVPYVIILSACLRPCYAS